MNQIKVSAKRHLAKTISYRIISTLFGFLIMWWATGSIEFGATFGIAELLYKPIQYYIHERIWYRWIKFGLVEKPNNKNIPFRKINNHLQEILSKERVIEEGVQPEKVIKTEPIIIKESILGIAESPQEKIKKLTYTKKSDK